MRGRASSSWVRLGVAVAALSSSCRTSPRLSPPTHDPTLGVVPAPLTAIDELSADLFFCRSIARGESALPPMSAIAAAPRRAFVSVHAPNQDVVVGSALGASLAESISLATRDAIARAPKDTVASSRLSLELVDRLLDDEATDDAADLGHAGAIVARGANVGFVLPSELLTRALMEEKDDDPAVDEIALNRLILQRFGARIAPGARRRFTTVSVVESSDRARALPVVRGRLPRLEPAAITPALLRARAQLAALELARRVGVSGRFVYEYDAIADTEVDDEYNDIRHAGATGSLFTAYAASHDSALKSAGDRALRWLGKRLRVAHGKAIGADDARVYLPDDENPMGVIGGTGLALIAFASEASATDDESHLPEMRAMARFLVGQLDDAGSFRPYVADGTPATEAYDVLYYPGEAMLSLLRLYAIDHDSRWIDAVRRAARWRLRTPYKGKRDSYRDFWFSLVLANLESIAHDDAIADRMRAIANGAMGEQDEEERDFALGDEAYALTPRANPTSTMLEAIATTIPRLRANGRSSEEIDRALDHGRRAASFVLWSQIDEESSWLARDPAQALGGVRGDSWRGYVRIDDDQHALMAMLALANAIDSTR